MLQANYQLRLVMTIQHTAQAGEQFCSQSGLGKQNKMLMFCVRNCIRTLLILQKHGLAVCFKVADILNSSLIYCFSLKSDKITPN